MGGALKVIIRFSDGRVISEVRGTNSLPFWIMHPRLIEGDESLLWEYAHAQSDFRDEDRSLVPVEYGIFAVDFIKTAQDTPGTARSAWPGRNARPSWALDGYA